MQTKEQKNSTGEFRTLDFWAIAESTHQTALPASIPTRVINNLLPQPSVNNNLVTRSILPIDPRTSGIILKELNFKSFHIWKLQLE